MAAAALRNKRQDKMDCTKGMLFLVRVSTILHGELGRTDWQAKHTCCLLFLRIDYASWETGVDTLLIWIASSSACSSPCMTSVAWLLERHILSVDYSGLFHDNQHGPPELQAAAAFILWIRGSPSYLRITMKFRSAWQPLPSKSLVANGGCFIPWLCLAPTEKLPRLPRLPERQFAKLPAQDWMKPDPFASPALPLQVGSWHPCQGLSSWRPVPGQMLPAFSQEICDYLPSRIFDSNQQRSSMWIPYWLTLCASSISSGQAHDVLCASLDWLCLSSTPPNTPHLTQVSNSGPHGASFPTHGVISCSTVRSIWLGISARQEYWVFTQLKTIDLRQGSVRYLKPALQDRARSPSRYCDASWYTSQLRNLEAIAAGASSAAQLVQEYQRGTL